MTREEKETLKKLVVKYMNENGRDAPSWGIKAAMDLDAALACEWILHNGFL